MTIAEKENFRSNKQHNVIMEDRKKLVISGVLEVDSFEEDNILVKTSKGDLTIRGNNLKMESYVSDVGDLVINGDVYALVYINDSEQKSGFLSRLFK